MISGLLEELSEKATALARSGEARNAEEAVDIALKAYCSDSEREQGLGQQPAAAPSSGASLFGSMWASLVGQPQSWYDNVNSLQNQLAILMAGISAIGSEVWDTIQAAYQPGGTSINDPGHFDSYDSTMARLGSDMAGLLITTNSMPTQDQVNSATYALAWWNPELTYATAMAPELASQVQADMAQSSAMVSASSLKSPAQVGATVFAQDVADRASALGAGILDWTKYLAYGLAAALGIFLLSKMSGGKS